MRSSLFLALVSLAAASDLANNLTIARNPSKNSAELHQLSNSISASSGTTSPFNLTVLSTRQIADCGIGLEPCGNLCIGPLQTCCPGEVIGCNAGFTCEILEDENYGCCNSDGLCEGLEVGTVVNDESAGNLKINTKGYLATLGAFFGVSFGVTFML